MADDCIDPDDIVLAEDTTSPPPRAAWRPSASLLDVNSFVAFESPSATPRASVTFVDDAKSPSPVAGPTPGVQRGSGDGLGSRSPRKVSFHTERQVVPLNSNTLDNISCNSAETQDADTPLQQTLVPRNAAQQRVAAEMGGLRQRAERERQASLAGTGAAGARKMSSAKRYAQKYGAAPAEQAPPGISVRQHSRRMSHTPGSGMLRRASSMSGAASLGAGSPGGRSMSQLSKRMSLATFAVAQRERNQDFSKMQNYGISDLKSSRDELEAFMAEDGWVEKSGLGVQGFRMACMASIKEALSSKKMSKRLMNKLAKKRLAKTMGVTTEAAEQQRRRIEAEEEEDAAAADTVVDSHEPPQALKAHRAPPKSPVSPVSPAVSSYAQTPTQQAFTSAEAFFRDRGEMSTRFEQAQLESVALARAETEAHTQPDGLGDAKSPLFSHRLRNKVKRPSSAPIWGRSRQTAAVYSTHEPPAMSIWRQRNFHNANTPISLAMQNTEPDTLQNLPKRVNWGGMLSEQRDDLAKLEAADTGYKNMLTSYKEIQRLIQQKMERLLITAGVEH